MAQIAKRDFASAKHMYERIGKILHYVMILRIHRQH